MRTLGLSLALLVATALGARTAAATAYVWDFQARVSAVHGDPGQSLALRNAGFAPGDLLTGHIEFDPYGTPYGLVDTDADPNSALYFQGNLKFRLDTPVTTFVSSLALGPYPTVRVSRVAGRIYYSMDVTAYDPGTGIAFRSGFGLELFDSAPPGLSDLSFPILPPALASLDPFNPTPGSVTTEFLGYFSDQNSKTASFEAELLSLTTPVPEPATGALVAAGVAALLVARRRPPR